MMFRVKPQTQELSYDAKEDTMHIFNNKAHTAVKGRYDG